MPTLDWTGKQDALKAAQKVPYRLLEFDSDNSCCGEGDNLIVQGDNLDALKSLLPFYRRRVKCIYIDPPYNTGSAFEHYDDNLEHATWLSMMYPRLELLREFLSDDGAVFISIDDNEQAHLKLVCDEIFGRNNFVAQFVCKSKLGKVGTASVISHEHEYIICYAKSFSDLKFNMIVKKSECRKENLRQWGQADRREDRPTMFYPIKIEGQDVFPIKDNGTEGRWRVSKEKAIELLTNGELELKIKNGVPNIYRNFSAGETFMPYGSWLPENISLTAKGTIALKNLGLNFAYPKPVELLEFILRLATNKNSIILDAFAGSGTTAHAVINLNAADGGNRKFILIEAKDYCKTITAERVKRIGGTFKFYRLGAELFDKAGAINQAVTFQDLAAYIRFKFTNTPYTPNKDDSPLIGIHDGAAYYLLGEKNLTKKILETLPPHDGEKIIFGKLSRISRKNLQAQGITFYQIPKDIR